MIKRPNKQIIACTRKIKANITKRTQETEKKPQKLGEKLPADNEPIFRKQAAPSLMYVGSRWHGIPHNFDKNGNKRHIKIA